MKRYQVYLNPQSVSIIDEVEKYLGISRSALIRETVNSLADNLAKILAQKTTTLGSYPSLNSLVGIFKTRGNKKVNLSEKKDTSYYRD